MVGTGLKSFAEDEQMDFFTAAGGNLVKFQVATHVSCTELAPLENKALFGIIR